MSLSYISLYSQVKIRGWIQKVIELFSVFSDIQIKEEEAYIVTEKAPKASSPY